jgi:ribonuclease-3
MNSNKNLDTSILLLEDKIDYTFNTKSLLIQALTHSSYANEMKMSKESNNERLEFLGDAVLELITSEHVYGKYETLSEGDLTKLRASLVCEPTLSVCAKSIDLGDYLLLGKGEDSSGGRMRESILSDSLEALIGSVYLDGGFTNAKEFIHKNIIKVLENKELFFDSKTILQEIVQNIDNKLKIRYKLISEEGPDHNKTFTMGLYIENEQVGCGEGKTKKAAEQEAALQGIKKLQS